MKDLRVGGKGRIEVRDLSVSFGKGKMAIHAIHELTISVDPGEFVCILGTSGCGKSTILNVLAGFIPPTSGGAYIDGKPISGPGPDRGMVFQQHALFPWKTVRENVEFGLRMVGIEKAERRRRGQDMIRLVGLERFENTYPGELSGGMEQRVGLARTLAVEPTVLLMDEPFGSLDAQTRMMMQELLLSIWQKSQKSVVFVTHDVEEAVLLADRLLVLTARPGQVKGEIQINLPRPRGSEIVTRPEFVRLKERALNLIRDESARSLELARQSVPR